MNQLQNRRFFLGRGLLGAATLYSSAPLLRAAVRQFAANEKLNIGIIGVANRGGDNLQGVSKENIVALCDVDENYLAAAAKRFPAART